MKSVATDHSLRYITLRHDCRKDGHGAPPDLDEVVKAIGLHQAVREVDLVFGQVYTEGQCLAGLGRCAGLEELHIRVTAAACLIQDEHLAAPLPCLPKLRSLALRILSSSGEAPSLTLRTLVHAVQYCPLIQSTALPVDATSAKVPVDIWTAQPHTSLVSLDWMQSFSYRGVLEGGNLHQSTHGQRCSSATLFRF